MHDVDGLWERGDTSVAFHDHYNYNIFCPVCPSARLPQEWHSQEPYPRPSRAPVGCHVQANSSATASLNFVDQSCILLAREDFGDAVAPASAITTLWSE